MRPVGAGGASGFGVCPYNILVVVGLDSGASGAGGKGGSDGHKESQAEQGTRRDTVQPQGLPEAQRDGSSGAALLGTAGCGSVFEGGGDGGGGGAQKPTPSTSTCWPRCPTWTPRPLRTRSRSTILTNVMEGLYRLDPDQEPIPAAAEGVEVSSDGAHYTFTLRDGIQWSNGDPVTSQDYKYAWLKVLDPETAATYAYIISTFVKGAAEYNTDKAGPEAVAIETPDDKTLRVELVRQVAVLLQLTAS